MRFKITRTSIPGADEETTAPHPKAFQDKVIALEYRNPIYISWGEFTEQGFNHRKEDDGFWRNVEITQWAIDINSLDEMMEFVRETERIVLEPGKIEIYDDYRD